MLAQYIGEVDRKVFVIAMLTIGTASSACTRSPWAA